MERSSTTDSDSAIAPPPVAAPTIPTNFGKYELITHLASGGMADIFLCRARGIQGFEKLAIIKRVRQDRAFDKKTVDLFLDEARLAASLQHPNIVQVFEFGIVEGSYFLAMEYVHGEDVHALLKRMRETKAAVPLAEVLAIVVGVCQGLHYAHECVGPNGRALGIVHRDISPSNVLISYDGAVMITDFGIAKATSRSSETTTGTVRGKLAYMSPEQCRGLALDRRSDIFAIGTLLHELSTGKALFGATSDFEVMKKIVEDGVRPPSAEVAGYPRELDAIVLKALARDPAQRYATARELQLDIERFAVEHKLAISSARLAGFMQRQFADRIAEWRERAALDYAARAATARPPSAEVEIIAADAAPTMSDAPAVPRSRRRARAGIIAGLAAVAAIVVVQRQLASSHAAAAAPPAFASSTVAAAPAPVPPPVVPVPAPIVSPTPAATATNAPKIATATATPRHRHLAHHRAAKPTASARAPAKDATTQHPPADWNPEDGLPPGAAH
ncbi:MAG TPA: serine/threonine-protein kinase [Polyangia bacterium]|jgi:tRNA A-37 threonylcarbamoyl transferase component Bud32